MFKKKNTIFSKQRKTLKKLMVDVTGMKPIKPKEGDNVLDVLVMPQNGKAFMFKGIVNPYNDNIVLVSTTNCEIKQGDVVIIDPLKQEWPQFNTKH